MAQRGKRSKAQRANDLIFTQSKVLRGWPHWKIAQALSEGHPYTLTRQQIQRDVKKLELGWLKEAAKGVADARAREIHVLEELHQELWVAWERSCKDAQTQAVEETSGQPDAANAKGDGQKPKRKKKVTLKGQCGDSSIAGRIIEVRARIAKLRGLDAPERTELSGPGGKPVEVENADKRPIDWERVGQELRGVFPLPKTNGNGQPVYPAHPAPETGSVPGDPRS